MTPLGLVARVVFGGDGAAPQRPFSRVERIRLVIEIVVSYVQLLWLLRREDLPTMVGRAREARTVLTPPADDAAALAAVARLGRVADRVVGVLPKDGRCLITSLVVIRVLARRSLDAKVVIGVRNEDGFAAHAWVEYEGHPLFPPGNYHRLVEV
ncbi:MAG TPA: lasso peptide biosynthesis B2 protein [Solirubrobacteraceae bacterium]|nr:lasso peptide biosynthesis B2 protein [Solirubrobacteraceae bacterium]